MKKSFTLIALFFSSTLFSQYSVTNTIAAFIEFKESLGVYKERILKNGDWWQEELDKVGKTGMTISKTSCEIENIFPVCMSKTIHVRFSSHLHTCI